MTGRTKRDTLKRNATQAYNHLDSALEDLLNLKNIFQAQHPDLAAGLDLSMQMILHSQELIEVFAQLAWGLKKENFEVYRR